MDKLFKIWIAILISLTVWIWDYWWNGNSSLNQTSVLYMQSHYQTFSSAGIKAGRTKYFVNQDCSNDIMGPWHTIKVMFLFQVPQLLPFKFQLYSIKVESINLKFTLFFCAWGLQEKDLKTQRIEKLLIFRALSANHFI